MDASTCQSQQGLLEGQIRIGSHHNHRNPTKG